MFFLLSALLPLVFFFTVALLCGGKKPANGNSQISQVKSSVPMPPPEPPKTEQKKPEEKPAVEKPPEAKKEEPKKEIEKKGEGSKKDKKTGASSKKGKKQAKSNEGDDGGYEQCPDMTPEELAKIAEQK